MISANANIFSGKLHFITGRKRLQFNPHWIHIHASISTPLICIPSKVSNIISIISPSFYPQILVRWVSTLLYVFFHLFSYTRVHHLRTQTTSPTFYINIIRLYSYSLIHKQPNEYIVFLALLFMIYDRNGFSNNHMYVNI